MTFPLARTNRWKRRGRFAVLLATLGLCSCTALGPRGVRETAGREGVQLIPDVPHQVAPRVAGVRDGGIQQIAWQQPAYAQPVAHSYRTEFHAAEPRHDLPVHFAGHDDVAPDRLAEMYPDEYLFDGGDRGLPFHYENFQPAGLESEDTLAEFSDHTGRPRVKPSSRVAIYSPRFASVTTLSTPHEEAASQMIVSADKTIQTYDMRARMGSTLHNEFLNPGGLAMRSRASGLGSNFETRGVDQTTIVARNDKLQNVFENLTFLSSGRFDKNELGLIAEYIDRALTWTQEEHAVIAAVDSAGMQVFATQLPMELVGIEDWRKTKGDLQLVKLADKKHLDPNAPPEERVVTFSLRYDNLGDFELKNIRITDNLTARLEFIAGSEVFTGLDGRLELLENGEGGHILVFHLEGELLGHRGGTIQFQARLR